MSKRNKVLVGTGAVVLIAALVVISAGARRDRGAEVRFEKASRRDLVAAVTASGKIQPKKKVDISADITGRITRIAVQHQVDQAGAAVRSASDNLRKTTLLAPMAGRVTRLSVEEGEVAVPGTFSKDVGLLLTVSDLSVIQVKVNVDETDVVRLHLGDSVEVTIDAFPDTTFTGRVTKVSNSAILTAAASTPGTNTQAVDYQVEITLTNPPADVRPDLPATARIVTDTRKQAPSIPIIALTVRENKPLSTENRTGDTPLPDIVILTHKLARDYDMGGEVVRALRGVSLQIRKNEYVAVMGPSGSGKSTLMNLVGCLDTPTAGEYWLNGQKVSDLSDDALARIRNKEIGFVF